ncbi:DUF4112 domain-containing protein [Glaciecola sp. 1036]|uniref:DUF4112 domain-containing protein n=1 Tax=Alteromonadaceae TaxID=72275 RepID=UPI003D046E45
MSEQKDQDSYEFRAPKELLKAQSLANLLDYSVRIPIINFHIGLDSLIGLIPGVGDGLMMLLSLRIIWLARKMNVPKPLISVMLRNTVIDFALGLIPIVGDIADMVFKANIRNVRIMEKYWVSQNKDAIDAMSAKKLQQWEEQQEKLDSHTDG